MKDTYNLQTDKLASEPAFINIRKAPRGDSVRVYKLNLVSEVVARGVEPCAPGEALHGYNEAAPTCSIELGYVEELRGSKGEQGKAKVVFEIQAPMKERKTSHSLKNIQ